MKLPSDFRNWPPDAKKRFQEIYLTYDGTGLSYKRRLQFSEEETRAEYAETSAAPSESGQVAAEIDTQWPKNTELFYIRRHKDVLETKEPVATQEELAQ